MLLFLVSFVFAAFGILRSFVILFENSFGNLCAVYNKNFNQNTSFLTEQYVYKDTSDV